MTTENNLILGFTDVQLRYSPLFGEINDEKFIKHYSSKDFPQGRILLALGQYLQHKNLFDRIFLYSTNEIPVIFSNGSSGIMGMVNRSEVDIDVTLTECDEDTMEVVDFIYPFKINDYTFITFKPEYQPHIFGIFQTFSLNVWMILASVFFAITVLSHFILKYKCSLGKVLFHVFAILMKQNAIIIPSSLMENFLIYSWVIGAMILCLSHDSVFLSFLSVPPLSKIKHLSDLAVAIQKGDYNCIAFVPAGIAQFFWDAEQEHLRVIADNIYQNYFRFTSLFDNFHRGNKTAKLAYITQTDILDIYSGKFYVSEDRFSQSTTSMSVRRGFCCKELLATFVHRMMASGIYFKYLSDFMFTRSSYFGVLEDETTKRKLTLTDLAPAFIFLLCGHFISLLVLCCEIISNRRNRRILMRRINMCSESSV